MDLQSFPVVPGTLTDLTGHIDIRQEVHFDLHQAIAGTGFTAAALDIEAEPAGAVAADLGIVGRCKQITDIVEQSRIGSGIGSWRSADGTLVNVDDLVQVFHTLHTAAFSGAGPGMVQLIQQCLIQHLVDQTGLSGAGNAGDTGEGPQGNGYVNILQIVLRCPGNRQEFAVSFPPLTGKGDYFHAGQVLSGDGILAGDDLIQGARSHDLTAAAARTGAHIHDEVRSAHGVLVMLHHDQGVADIPQMLQSSQKLIIVPLVQADRGFVQNIQHAHQGGTDLGSQPDSLALAAGESTGRAGKGQIAEAHIRQELEPGLDLLHDLLRNHRHIALQLQFIHKLQLVLDAHGAEFHDAHAAYGDSPGNVRKPLAAALGTGGGGHTFLQLLPGGVGLRLLIAAGNIVQNALPGLLQHTHAVAPVVGHPQLLSLGSVEDDVHHFPAERFHRGRQGEVVFLGQSLKVHPEDGICPGAAPAGSLNCSVENRQALIRNYQVFIRHQPEAQAGAAGAGTGRIVEGKHPGFQLRQADTAILTGIVLGEVQLLFCGGQFNGHKTAGMGTGSLDGVR